MSSGKDMELQGEKDIWRAFVLNIIFVLLLFLLGIYIGIFFNNKKLIESEILARARSHVNDIVLTRRWNAMYGGVFVEKKPGVQSNPYLENPDIRTVDGKVYTKKNPALMTREISELAKREGSYQFHITSLKPLNPDNGADAFETEALKSFESGLPERFVTVTENSRKYFRYMAPLLTEESCLACHSKQGYKVGDIRGGISVTFDITEVSKILKYNKPVIIFLFVLTTCFLVISFSYSIWKLQRRLGEMIEKIRTMAITDELTKVANRRYGFSRLNEELVRSKRYHHPFALLLMDLDHFKTINDTHGHQTGDLVLEQVASFLKNSVRESDVVLRYGGEEFAICLPETGRDQTMHVAEKLRLGIEQLNIPTEGRSLAVTASIGATVVAVEDLARIDSLDVIVTTADRALYLAKDKGRNRVEFINM